MKRFVLLVGDDYYPGGWDDYAGQFDTLEAAMIAGMKTASRRQWYSVFDLVEEKEAASG